MLLEFKISNYKSFKEEMVFSLVPTSQKELDYSIMEELVNTKNIKGLCSAVIYGPNAAGKSNIIGAFDTFRNIVIRGNIRNSNISSSNIASNNLELIPFINNNQNNPVNFYVKFTEENMLFEYYISLDLGRFYDKEYNRKILKEELTINGKNVYSRDNKVKINIKYLNQFNNKLINNINYIDLANNNLVNDELFLNNGFKSIFSSSVSTKVIKWFSDKLKVFYKVVDFTLKPQIVDITDDEIYPDTLISKVALAFGSNSDGIGIIKTGDKSGEFASIIKTNGKSLALPLDKIESLGTIRFINEFPIILNALMTGSTLVIDEFDASIHPMALMNIINIFHNDEINVNHAQLIFNTQNPIFLNNKLFRRDEIKFVEINELTHQSTSYALSDFKTSSVTRNTSDYLSNYFINKYGAIRDIDFSNIIINTLNNNNGKNKNYGGKSIELTKEETNN